MYAAVRSVLEEEVLHIGDGNVIDLGDCCANQWRNHSLTLRNISDASLDISFTTDSPYLEFQLDFKDMKSPSPEPREDEMSQSQTLELARGRSKESSVLSKREPSRESSIDSHGSREHTNVIDPSEFTATDKETMQSEFGADENYEEGREGDYLDDLIGDGKDFRSASPEQSLGHDLARIDELMLRPGQERSVEVCYRAAAEPLGLDRKGARFSRESFRIFLTYSNSVTQKTEKKTIQCRARVCTSYVTCESAELDFGDTDVGTLKSLPLRLINISDLEAHVEVKYVSKILNIARGELIIPPRQSIDVKIDIFPRKVNPGTSSL